jgi:hypothetical protein
MYIDFDASIGQARPTNARATLCFHIQPIQAKMEYNWTRPNTKIKYNKGDRRWKHCGATEFPQASTEADGSPGICPNTISIEEATKVLQHGIPEFRKTSLDRPYRIWAYHKGAIYAARTEDGGTRWHAYPVKTGIPQSILSKIQEENPQELRSIKKWLRK